MKGINPRCSTCHIRDCSVLRHSSESVLAAISDRKKYRFVKKGEVLLEEGYPSKDVFFIKSGIAKLVLHARSQQPLVLRLAAEGSLFGHRVKTARSIQPLSVIAVENMYVCQLDAQEFFDIAGNGSLHEEVVGNLFEEMHHTEMQALRLATQPVKARVAATLLHIAAIYQYRPGGNGIHVQLDRKDIGALSGTTKEQVSRILAELQADKLLKFRAKHFKYFNLEALERVIDDCIPKT